MWMLYHSNVLSEHVNTARAIRSLHAATTRMIRINAPFAAASLVLTAAWSAIVKELQG
jgi:hypothetical protein